MNYWKETDMRYRNLLVVLFALALVAAACGDSGSTTTGAAGTEAPATEAPATEAPATEAPATEAPMTFPPEAGPLGGVLIGAGEPVQIRTLQSISGATEFLGVDQNRGTELALEDYGDIKGHSVDLGVFEDDLCSAEGGTAGAQAIVAQEGVLGVIGTTCSGAGVPASQIFSEAGMVLISGSNTSPSLTSDLQGNANEAYNPGYYRTAHNDLFQGQAAAEYAYTVLGFTTAAAIHDGDPYTEGLARSFANAFEELGGTVSVFTAVNKGDTDMTPVLTEVAAGDPEIIYFPIFQPEGDFIAQQVRGVAGLEDVQLFGADGLFVGGEGGFMALPESEGMYFSGPNLVFENVGYTGVSYTDLKARYEASYGEAPLAAFHAHTYDATMLLLSSIEAVAVEGPDGELWVDRQALRDQITATSGFPGMTGSLTCDAFGDCGSQAIAIFFHDDSTAEDAIAAATVVANLTKDGGFSTTE
jgi:branched-chain amino acid transport system substrate-binding protein